MRWRAKAAPAVTRKLKRSKMHEFFSQIEPCLIGMEACGSAHYWARELKAMGHEVLLMPPAYTKPYVKRGKNDAVDADAICEAMSRPGMRFVPIKSAEQQATLMLHKTRELLVKQRTMSVNALRGHLSEFGIVVAKGIGRVDELLDLAESDATLPAAAKAGVKVLAQASRRARQSRSTNWKAKSPAPTRKARWPVAGQGSRHREAHRLGDHSQRAGPERVQVGTRFRRLAWPHTEAKFERRQARRSAASPSRATDTSGRLLVLGATSLLNVVGKRKGALRDWIVALLAKKPARLVTVALANKLARILWAMMKTGEGFRAEMFAKA